MAHHISSSHPLSIASQAGVQKAFNRLGYAARTHRAHVRLADIGTVRSFLRPPKQAHTWQWNQNAAVFVPSSSQVHTVSNDFLQLPPPLKLPSAPHTYASLPPLYTPRLTENEQVHEASAEKEVGFNDALPSGAGVAGGNGTSQWVGMAGSTIVAEETETLTDWDTLAPKPSDTRFPDTLPQVPCNASDFDHNIFGYIIDGKIIQATVEETVDLPVEPVDIPHNSVDSTGNNIFKHGDAVRLVRLVTKKSLNGTEGKLGNRDPLTGRWQVITQSRTVCVKSDNIEIVTISRETLLEYFKLAATRFDYEHSPYIEKVFCHIWERGNESGDVEQLLLDLCTNEAHFDAIWSAMTS